MCRRCNSLWRQQDSSFCLECEETLKQQIECLKYCPDPGCPSKNEFIFGDPITCDSGIRWSSRHFYSIPSLAPSNDIIYSCEGTENNCLERWLEGTHFCMWCWKMTYLEQDNFIFTFMSDTGKLIKNAYNFRAFLFI